MTIAKRDPTKMAKTHRQIPETPIMPHSQNTKQHEAIHATAIMAWKIASFLVMAILHDANIELIRTISRRVGKMERTGLWAIGTRTEAERQELSG